MDIVKHIKAMLNHKDYNEHGVNWSELDRFNRELTKQGIGVY